MSQKKVGNTALSTLFMSIVPKGEGECGEELKVRSSLELMAMFHSFFETYTCLVMYAYQNKFT